MEGVMIGLLIAAFESLRGRAKGQVEESQNDRKGAVEETKGEKEDAKGNDVKTDGNR
jgi:hypothetical protein